MLILPFWRGFRPLGTGTPAGKAESTINLFARVPPLNTVLKLFKEFGVKDILLC
jgi:hypothetical protein